MGMKLSLAIRPWRSKIRASSRNGMGFPMTSWFWPRTAKNRRTCPAGIVLDAW